MSRFFLPIILLFLTRILNSEPVFGQYQHNYGFYMPKYPIQYPVQHQQHAFFRSGLNTNYPSAPPSLYSSNNDEVQNHQMSRQSGDPRFGLFDFFTTYTFTVSFTTRTTTITATTICTTSAAFVKTCSAGRRRRDLYLEDNNENLRGLFYNEDEYDGIFLPSPRNENSTVAIEAEPTVLKETPAVIVPYVAQSGFQAPDFIGSARFGLAVTTSTAVATRFTTTTRTLTATCQSTTSYSKCSSSGKK